MTSGGSDVDFSDRTPHHHHRSREDRLRKSLTENPDDPEGRTLLGLYLAIRGLHRQAMREARLALRLDPETALAHYVLSLTLPGQFPRPRKLVEAIAEAEEAVRLDPLSPPFYVQLAHLQLLRYSSTLQARHALSALQAAEAGVAVDPLDVPCTVLLRMALGKVGRHEEAEAAFSTALTLDPEAAYTHASYGEYLFSRGQCGRAMASLREASRLEAGCTGHRRKLGLVSVVKWAVDGITGTASSPRLIRPDPGIVCLERGEWKADVNWHAGLLPWLSVMSAMLLILLDDGDVSIMAFCVPASLLSVLSAVSLGWYEGVKRVAPGFVSDFSGLLWLVVTAIMFLWPDRISCDPRAVIPVVRLGAWFQLNRAMGLLSTGGMLLFLAVVSVRACFARKTPCAVRVKMPW